MSATAATAPTEVKPPSKWEKIVAGIRPDLMRIAEGVAKACREIGLACEDPYEDVSDGVHVSVRACLSGEEEVPEANAYCDIELIDATDYGDEDGVAVRADLVLWGGGMLGDWCPYNYTPDVWISTRQHHRKILALLRERLNWFPPFAEVAQALKKGLEDEES